MGMNLYIKQFHQLFVRMFRLYENRKLCQTQYDLEIVLKILLVLQNQIYLVLLRIRFVHLERIL